MSTLALHPAIEFWSAGHIVLRNKVMTTLSAMWAAESLSERNSVLRKELGFEAKDVPRRSAGVCIPSASAQSGGLVT